MGQNQSSRQKAVGPHTRRLLAPLLPCCAVQVMSSKGFLDYNTHLTLAELEGLGFVDVSGKPANFGALASKSLAAFKSLNIGGFGEYWGHGNVLPPMLILQPLQPRPSAGLTARATPRWTTSAATPTKSSRAAAPFTAALFSSQTSSWTTTRSPRSPSARPARCSTTFPAPSSFLARASQSSTPTQPRCEGGHQFVRL
jgi:hypothetical protein